jgi:acyl-CoA synthetase (AMP-forming)/AMP-acid ligase II
VRYTYAELLAAAGRAARALRTRFEPGARIAVWANNIPEWVILEYGAALAGVTIVTVNPGLRHEELAHVLGKSRAEGIFLLTEYRGNRLADILAEVRSGLPALREAVLFSHWDDFCLSGTDTELPSVQADEAAQIQFTSGTTGSPKGAVLTHRGIVNNARMWADRFGLERGHVLLSPMPLFHTAGCVLSVLGALASPVITQTAPDDTAADRAETLGRPLPCIEVKIADPQSQVTLAIGKVGEICTRGYHVMSGYFDEPELSAAVIDADGWLHTGDLGSMEARGLCRIEGRLKDMIIRGGENIYPREIEQILCEHPQVADAAVVGVPDERWGEEVAAFIRLAVGKTVDQEELFGYCRERLAPYKTPVHWFFLDEFPLTASGKVQKHALRARVFGAPLAGSSTET